MNVREPAPSNPASSILRRRAVTLAAAGTIGLGMSLLAPMIEIVRWIIGFAGL
ncbi:MAG: hypothetical protein RIB57_07525 [Pelagibacterium sp.]|uniref:hypothetical protein n=1 Tax=Pelagibacterium sp. TaxID=1967288 RepID=UPI0032F01B99